MDHLEAKNLLRRGGNRIFTATRYVKNGNDRVRCFIATGTGEMEDVTYLCHKIGGFRWSKQGELSISGYGTSPSATVVRTIAQRLYGSAEFLKEVKL